MNRKLADCSRRFRAGVRESLQPLEGGRGWLSTPCHVVPECGAVTYPGMATRSGLDTLAAGEFRQLRGKSIGVVCNQASISRELRHVIELLLPLHRAGYLEVAAVFGPQHGLNGHTQDNMIEWEGAPDPPTGFTVYSLYGQRREPSDESLRGLDLLLIDLQDVGARYYTFVWTMALCLKACERNGVPVMVLDRPNPIGGRQVEGTVLDPSFASFVGLYPLPTRHGMTIGEIATYLVAAYLPRVELQVVRLEGWRRDMYFEQTGLPWAMPSPNMPTVDSSVVYPGACLLEGTNLSEGRGTTRPFEMVGAPGIDGAGFSEALNDLKLAGAYFRPVQFQPTFNKYAGQICGGAFIHVTDRSVFQSVLTFVAVLQEAQRRGNEEFAWKPPPYEYEINRLPIDILAGTDWLRLAIQNLNDLGEINERMQDECRSFDQTRLASLIYG